MTTHSMKRLPNRITSIPGVVPARGQRINGASEVRGRVLVLRSSAVRNEPEIDQVYHLVDKMAILGASDESDDQSSRPHCRRPGRIPVIWPSSRKSFQSGQPSSCRLNPYEILDGADSWSHGDQSLRERDPPFRPDKWTSSLGASRSVTVTRRVCPS